MPRSEKSLIERIRHRARSGSAVIQGIGDDCAVLRVPSGHDLLVTTDFTLENVHFRREWHSAEVIGRRCITRGLSDIAAMGGEPRAAFLSLALESRTPQKWVDRFLEGLMAAAREWNVPLAGGDTAQSLGGIQADIVVVGSAPKGTAIARSGARPGDAIYVTGSLGGSAAAIAQLRKGKLRAQDYQRHFHPTARIEVGRWLRRRQLASAIIDLSDGLSTDLAHLCEESGVGAEIDAAAIPRARVGRGQETVSTALALHGGEDYELLFTSRRKTPATIFGVSVTCIGRIRRGSEITLIEGQMRRDLVPRGWEHFRSRV